MITAAEQAQCIELALVSVADISGPASLAQIYSLDAEPARESVGDLGLVAIVLLIAAAVIWLLAGIHETTVQACPTMDAACQINQESPE